MSLVNGLNLIQTFMALVVIRCFAMCCMFYNVLLKFIRLFERKIFNINDPFRMKTLTGLRLGFSELLKHQFRPNFKDTLMILNFQ